VFLLFSCKGPDSVKMPEQELFNLTRAQVIEKTLKPYAGPSKKGVDTGTMTGKVMCGYQGWFTCPGDGSARGWFHWGKDVFEPGNCTIDLWPDMTEYDKDERYPTSFKFADGGPAYVFSSMNTKTVSRHFKWMRDYGIHDDKEDAHRGMNVLAECLQGRFSCNQSITTIDVDHKESRQTGCGYRPQERHPIGSPRLGWPWK
jgi:hypothetical protein